MTELSDKVERSLARFERITETLDARTGVRPAAARERNRSLGRYGKAATTAGIAVLGVCLMTIIIGMVVPIGMFGFLAAVGIALVLGGYILFHTASQDDAPLPKVETSLANGPMVDRFDSYLFKSRRALPAPAQRVIDQISQELPTLKQTLERVDAMDPAAQDARRLMSVHLPGLMERYANVPAAYRRDPDAEGKSVDDRLVDSLDASRAAIGEISERLARQDLDAFQTQGRFIESRYGSTPQIGTDGPAPAP
jgi:hypothetical protein